MKRKSLLACIIVLTAVLLTSSMIAISQAGGPNKPEFVRYDLRATLGTATAIIDDSNFPIVKIDVTGRPPEGIIACNVTIDGKVYSYPKDFDYRETGHLEFNAITGDGTETITTTLIFNLHGKPSLTEWLVLSVTGVGSPPTPFANAHFEGNFDITGTKLFALVEGFGLEQGYSLPPDYANLYVHHFGLIKGWSL